MNKRSIFLAVVALALAISALAYWRRPTTPTWQWQLAPVARGTLELHVTATGTLNAVRTVSVGTQVSGPIARLYVDFNSVVKQGQVIAELDKTVLQAALDDAQTSVQKAQVQLQQSQREYDRARELYVNKVSSKADYETATTSYLTAKATLHSAESQLSKARLSLGYATIKAPIAGVVVDRKVAVGQTVAASFSTPTLFTIAGDLTQMQVEANIDEADIGQVKVGQPVSFEVDAFPGRTFAGRVQQIRLQPTTTSSVVTYTVIVRVPNQDRVLLPGMTANLTIRTERHPDALLVPASALVFAPPADYLRHTNQAAPAAPAPEPEPGDRATVWVAQGQQLRPVAVVLGATDGVTTQVTGPLAAGQQVATSQLAAKASAGTSLLPSPPGGKNSGPPPAM